MRGKSNAKSHLPKTDVLYCLMLPTSLSNIFVIVTRNSSEPASSESFSSHKLGSSRNLSITFPVNTSSGGFKKCLRMALRTLRSLTSPVL